MKSFQTITLVFFGLMVAAAVIVFAKFPAKSDTPDAIAGASGIVDIWGTFANNSGMEKNIGEFNKKYGDSFTVKYHYHDPVNFDSDIVEALASGRGPDILLLPDDLILRHTDKIQLIPYTAVSQLSFQSTFIQASEIYMRSQGLIALPFAVDPIVMYWNRDLFNNASIPVPPKYWDEFLTLAPKLTKRDPKTSDIIESTISFGEYANVENAKNIMAMLFLQVGNSIVRLKDGKPVSDIQKIFGREVAVDSDVVSAFRFYMDFSNPLKNIYSWSRGLPNSRDYFIRGNLAVYFDFASAYKTLQQKNPHLNFAVAPVPQLREAKTEITFARMHGLAVLKTSDNMQTAFVAIQRLLENQSSARFAQVFGLPPVRRDLLSVRPTDAVMSVLYDSAIRARTWLDPRPEVSNKAFQQTVESVSSGRNDVQSAVNLLDQQLQSALVIYQ